MLVLLPPSEGKTAPAAGAPVDLAKLAFAAELTESRRSLLAALAGLSALPLERAVAMLGVSAGQAGEVDVDAGLRGAPAAPAAEVYSGVLYDRLGLPALPAAARRRVLIASALWGAVRPGDRIPYYRLAAKAKLPEIGGLAAFWRAPLAAALPDREGELVVDMRSGAYAAFWKPRAATRLAVRAFSERGGQAQAGLAHGEGGARRSRQGAAARRSEPPADPEAAAALAEAAGFRVELSPGHLDVIVAG